MSFWRRRKPDQIIMENEEFRFSYIEGYYIFYVALDTDWIVWEKSKDLTMGWAYLHLFS